MSHKEIPENILLPVGFKKIQPIKMRKLTAGIHTLIFSWILRWTRDQPMAGSFPTPLTFKGKALGTRLKITGANGKKWSNCALPLNRKWNSTIYWRQKRASGGFFHGSRMPKNLLYPMRRSDGAWISWIVIHFFEICRYLRRPNVNRLFPSYLVPLFPNKSLYKTFRMKTSLICMGMNL